MIIRDWSKSPRMNGVVAPNLQSILASLKTGRNKIIADLTLGAWRGGVVAREFAEQLGGTIPFSFTLGSDASSEGQIGRFIDYETQGDIEFLNPFRSVELVLNLSTACQPIDFLVLAPTRSQTWGDENVTFLDLLARAFDGSGTHIALVAADPRKVSVPSNWQIDWRVAPVTKRNVRGVGSVKAVPGIISKQIAKKLPLTGCHRLNNGLFLVPPECRIAPEPHSILALKERLGPGIPNWLKAYCQLTGGIHKDVDFLCRCSAAALLEGGFELALLLASSAVDASSEFKSDRSQGYLSLPQFQRFRINFALAQLQGLRITLRRNSELYSAPTPEPYLPTDLYSFLLQAKAWGALSVGRLIEADTLFHKAELISRPRANTLGYQYLLNSYALCRLRLGDATQALAFEDRISTWLDKNATDTDHLFYINRLNKARLMRQAQRFAQADEYYCEAFSTTEGVPSESDLIYSNFSRGKNWLLAQRKEASIFILRACAHWVASQIPEALAPRVVQSIVGIAVEKNEKVEQVSEALLSRLRDVLPLASPFVADRLQQSLKEQGSAGWLLRHATKKDRVCLLIPVTGLDATVGISTTGSDPLVRSPAFDRLTAVMVAFIRNTILCEFTQMRELYSELGTILLDTVHGCKFPSELTSILSSAICLRARRVVYVLDGKTYDFRLSDELQRRLWRQSWVRLSPSIASLHLKENTGLVKFRRYISPLSLNETQSKLVGAIIKSDRPLRFADFSSDVQKSMRWLVDHHVLTIKADPSSVLTEGDRIRPERPYRCVIGD